jgi:hypothetical protein
MSIEGGPNMYDNKPEEPENSEVRDKVLKALDDKLREYGGYSGKTAEAAIKRYEDMIKGIEKGDEKTDKKATEELGFVEVTAGSQKLVSERLKTQEEDVASRKKGDWKLTSEKMKIKPMSRAQEKEVEGAFSRDRTRMKNK